MTRSGPGEYPWNEGRGRDDHGPYGAPRGRREDPDAPTEGIPRRPPPRPPYRENRQPPPHGYPPPPRGGQPPRDDSPGRDGGERTERVAGATPPPRKLTLPRVAAWRGRLAGQKAVNAFNRAARADGAHESGLTSLTYAVMCNYASDAAMAVALANTLFFAAAAGESTTKVALYLLITVAPFGLIAPVIGPLLDRIQHGRRIALAATYGISVLALIVMAFHFQDWLLYPAALAKMVLSKSFTVLKAAVTPRVLPPKLPLDKTNARLTTFGLAASGVAGAVAAGVTKLFGSPGALWFSALICVGGAVLCMRIPAWVESTRGEVPATMTTRMRPVGRSRRRHPMGPKVAVVLWGNGTVRVLTGFMMLFSAFAIKAHTQHEPFMQLLLLGLIGAAAGVGGFAGNAIGSRMPPRGRDQLVIVCVAASLASTVLAAVLAGIFTMVLVGLTGAMASALTKITLDAVIQDEVPDASRASAFGRSETVLQLSWVFGGAVGVLLPPDYWVGFAVVSALLAIGLAQTMLYRAGRSLIPGAGRRRPESRQKPGAPRYSGTREPDGSSHSPYGEPGARPSTSGPRVAGRTPNPTKTMPTERYE